MRVYLARHGEKESEAGPNNFNLLVTPRGEAGVRSTACALLAAAQGAARVTAIVSSPFPRCLRTAAIYAAELGIASVSVEPGLSEVLTADLGCKGCPAGGVPAWTLDSLRAHAPGVALLAAAPPIVAAEELRAEAGAWHREEAQGRASRVAAAIGAAGSSAAGTLYVSHGSLCRRIVDCLTRGVGGDCPEPPMGSVLCIDVRPDGASVAHRILPA
jgi:broad specificity phosphatase PhoE